MRSVTHRTKGGLCVRMCVSTGMCAESRARCACFYIFSCVAVQLNTCRVHIFAPQVDDTRTVSSPSVATGCIFSRGL